jgi:glycolate oxidase
MLSELKKLINPQRVITEKSELYTYSYDATRLRHMPFAVVRPVSREEVVKTLKFASARGIPVVPRGSGTSLTGASVPVRGGIVLDFSLMNHIKEIDTKNSLVVVEPGVVYDELNRVLAGKGFYFPSEPGSGKVCTVGGMAGTNATGIRAVKYGPTRDYVLAIEVVLASGKVLRLGSKARTTSSGYSIKNLFVGSEGTLGAFTELTLHIVPKPTHFSTARMTFNSIEDAANAVPSMMEQGIRPSVLEILDSAALQTIRSFSKVELPEAEAMLLLEIDGFCDDVETKVKKATEICKASGASRIEYSKNAVERDRLWEARKAAYPCLARRSPLLLSEDVTVPVSRLSELLREIRRISRKYRIRTATFGHAGEGVLHPNFLLSDKSELGMAKKAMKELFITAIRLEGTISGEHGIGFDKADLVGIEHRSSLPVMKGIKKLLDPCNIMNPGKVFR